MSGVASVRPMHTNTYKTYAVDTPHQVLLPANFIEHKFKASENQALLDAGMYVGLHVELLNRTTVEFGPKNVRRDIQVGAVGVIKGVAKDLVVVEFTTILNKVEISADHALKIAWLKKAEHVVAGGTGVADGAEGKSGVKPSSKYAFLTAAACDDGKTDTIDIIHKWSNCLTASDSKVNLMHCQSTMCAALAQVSHHCPTYTEKDLILITRNGRYELWTMRDFKPKEIMFCPDSTDLRDRFWSVSVGKACRLGNSEKIAKSFSLDGKPMVIDGRLRSAVTESRSCALFWLVGHTDDPKAASMELHDVETSMVIKLTLPGAKKQVDVGFNGEKGVVVPVMVNAKALKAHSRLMCLADAALFKMTGKMQADAMKEKDAKEAKRKDTDGGGGAAKMAKI
jgi:hypothetical protein